MTISGKHTLTLVVKIWLFAALIGQWLFAVYIFKQFALELFISGQSEASYSHMIKGYVPGDSFGNGVLIVHLLPAIVLSACGIVQLMPIIQKRYPFIHRWNGRVFLLLGIAGALTGLYLTWLRDSRLSDISALGTTFNGLLIIVFAAFAWKFALQKQFAIHQRMAVHTFILINGVWHFRLYLMGWYMVELGPMGNNATLDGPADIILSFACYLLPMAFAEVYFWAKRQRANSKVWAAAALLTVGAAITTIGVVAATLMMWLPRIMA